MQLAMDVVGRMPPSVHTSGNERPVPHARRERPGNISFQNSTENEDERKHPSPIRTPRVVKSLVSGSILRPERSTTTDDDDGKNNNSSSSNSERIFLDMTSEGTKPKTTISPSSFLTSIGACARVGTSFLNEHKEETRFQYGVSDVSHSGDSNADGRRLYNCYRSNKTCNDDEKKMEDLMVGFSNAGLSTERSRTCTTTETTASRENTVTVESIGGGILGRGGSSIKPGETGAASQDAFSNARRLLFGEEKTSTPTTTRKELSSFRCNSQSNVLCNERNPCLNQIETDNDNRRSSSFLQWYSQPSPVSPNSIRSAFSVPQTLYTAAYGDDDNDNVSDNASDDDENDGTTQARCSLFESTGGNISFTAANTDKSGHHEIQYWMQRLHYATKHYGKTHSSTADAYFNLGRTQMNLSPNSGHGRDTSIENSYGLPTTNLRDAATKQKHRYDLAIENLTIAHGIWELNYGPEHLAVGRALDSLALAIVKRANYERSTSGRKSGAVVDDLRYARRLLEQAFSIRVHHLGVWHVDTVETYNKLASVLLHLGLLSEACKAYHEVFLVRRAIFGNHHPSVAISAHALANCHYKRGTLQESLRWYKTSLEVYEAMGLSYRHQAVVQLLKDQSRLEEFMDLEM